MVTRSAALQRLRRSRQPLKQKDEEKRLAVTLVNLMGTILMLTLPVISLLAFHHDNFLRGALIGGTVQSVGQVIASATMVNEPTTTYATLFKNFTYHYVSSRSCDF